MTGLINGTFSGGMEYGLLVENGTYQVPSIGVYGTTTDGYGFYVYGSGVGPITGQSAQLVRLFYFLPLLHKRVILIVSRQLRLGAHMQA